MTRKPLLLAIAIASQASAQEADYELVTTAIHTIRAETALPVTVLAGDELREASRATLGETLANQPGISNASFGPAVGQTVIRGQQGRRVMNLSNAIPNADASGNSADHSVTVEPILADAIEVLRGPSTLLYGGGAIGGVVNVIDNRIPRSHAEKPAFSLEGRHDSAADQDNLAARLDFSTGNIAWHLDGLRREWNDLDIPGFATDPAYLEDDHDDHDDEDHDEELHDDEAHEEDEENVFGHIPNSGGKTEAFTAGASWIFDSGFIGVAVSKLDNVYGLPSGAHDHGHAGEHDEHEEGEEADHEDEEHGEEGHGEGNVYIDLERTRYDLTGEWLNLAPWIEHVDYRLSLTEYAHAEMEGPGQIGTQFSNDSWQQRLQITHKETGNWHGAIGLQTSDEAFSAIGDESFIPVTDISSRGLFVVEDYHSGPYTVEVGARFNRDDYDPQNTAAPSVDFSTLNYSAAMLWDINSQAALGLTASHAERAPSVEELYSNFGLQDMDDCIIHYATGACEIGNTGFKEEVSRNIDATLYLEQDWFSATLTAFYNNFDDYIGQITTGDEVGEFPVRAYRQLDARFRGLELDVTFMLTDYLNLQVFGDTIDGDLDGNGDAPRMPPSRIGSRLDYNGSNWSAYVSVLHADAQNQPGNFERETASYTRWDMGADITFSLGESDLMLFLRGRNLGDEEIRLSTSYLRGFAPEAGRSVETGFRFSF